MTTQTRKNDQLIYFLRLYYIVLAVIASPVFISGWIKHKNLVPISSAPFTLFTSPTQFSICFFLLIIFFIFTSLYSALFPQKKVYRILTCLFLTINIGILSSYGKVLHGLHGWIFSSFFISFIAIQSSASALQSYNQLIAVKISAVIPYHVAGLWKVRGAISCLNSEGFSCLTNSLARSIGSEYIRNNHDLNYISRFFLEYSYIGATSFFLLVYFQVCSIIIVFKPKTHTLFALFMVLFHVSSHIILKIPFYHQMILILLLFFFSPFSKRAGLLEGTLNLPGTHIIAKLINSLKANFTSTMRPS